MIDNADDQLNLQINEGDNWTKELAIQLAEQTVKIVKNDCRVAEIGAKMLLQVSALESGARHKFHIKIHNAVQVCLLSMTRHRRLV